MTIQTIPGGLIIPHTGIDMAGAPSISTVSLNAANEQVGIVFEIPKTGNIRKSAVYMGTVGGSGDWIFDVRLETVSVTAMEPSGTLWDTNTNVSHTMASTEDNQWHTTAAFTADAAVTKGELAAIVWKCTTALASFVDFTKFVDYDFEELRHARSLNDVGAGWVAITGNQPLVLLVEYDDGSYSHVFGVPAFSTANTTSVGNAAAVRRFALKFKLSVPATIDAAWFWIDADGDFDLILYDSDGSTVLSTKSIDKDQRAGTDAAPTLWTFPDVTLAKDTFYRIAVVPSSATTCDVYDKDVGAVARMGALEGGPDFHLSTHNGTSWSDTTTKQPFAGIRLNGFDDATGAGGGTVNLLRGKVG